MKWLAECSAEALDEALRVVAPQLAGCSITIARRAGEKDPLWQSSSAIVGERFIAKFAWSRPAALRLAREIGVLTALSREPRVPFLPEVVASGLDPLLLVTRRVPGKSLFDVVGSINRGDRAGRQLARFLAALHDPAALERAEHVVGKLTGAHLPPATATVVRERFGRWILPDQRQALTRWCGWAEAVLACPAPAVLVHGDLHGDNQVWDGDHASLPAAHRPPTVGRPGHGLASAPRPRRCVVAHRGRHPTGRPPDTGRVGR